MRDLAPLPVLLLEKKAWEVSRMNAAFISRLLQGPLKIWTEHFTQSHFMRLRLREEPFGGILDHDFLWL